MVSNKNAKVVRGIFVKFGNFWIHNSAWRFIRILVLLFSLAATAFSLEPTRPPSQDSHIYPWSHNDDGFWSSLAQLIVSVFSSLCMVLSIFRQGKESLHISLPLFLFSLVVSAGPGIPGIAMYDTAWRFYDYLRLHKLALIEGIDKNLA